LFRKVDPSEGRKDPDCFLVDENKKKTFLRITVTVELFLSYCKLFVPLVKAIYLVLLD